MTSRRLSPTSSGSGLSSRAGAPRFPTPSKCSPYIHAYPRPNSTEYLNGTATGALSLPRTLRKPRSRFLEFDMSWTRGRREFPDIRTKQRCNAFPSSQFRKLAQISVPVVVGELPTACASVCTQRRTSPHGMNLPSPRSNERHWHRSSCRCWHSALEKSPSFLLSIRLTSAQCEPAHSC